MLFVVIIVKLMEMKILYSLVKKFNLQFLLSLFIPFFFFNLFCFILFLFFIFYFSYKYFIYYSNFILASKKDIYRNL